MSRFFVSRESKRGKHAEFRHFPDGVQKKALNQIARRCGFVRRTGKLTPYEFLVLMTVGQMAMAHPSLAGMVEAIRAKISREALHLRFTARAAEFLLACLESVLNHSARPAGITPSALQAFKRVFIFDSSSWDIDPNLKHVLPGSGGGASDANCKLQAGYEYKSGRFSFFAVTEGIKPDQAYSGCLCDFVEKGDLMLTDLGYFKLNVFQKLTAKGAWFLSRFLIGTTLRDAATSEKIDLGATLRRVVGNVLEMNVIMGNDEHQVPCRLIGLRVTEQAANARRRKLRKEAKKKGRTPSRNHLALCDWTLFVTNTPSEILSVKFVLSLYRLRWQIELVFKQLKSVLRIHSSNTAREERLKCELYGKLIMAALIHCIHSSLNAEMWRTGTREVSFDKLYKRIQERAFSLLRNMLSAVATAIKQFLREIDRLAVACIKTRQPSRKTTLELLENSLAPSPS